MPALPRSRHWPGHDEAAIASFEKAVEIEPGNLASLLGLAGALAKLARCDEAIACFERAWRLRPNRMMCGRMSALAKP